MCGGGSMKKKKMREPAERWGSAQQMVLLQEAI
jgi:hypothetical protein